MPPTTTIANKDKERPANRKRSPSVIHKVWNFARNAGGPKPLPPSHPRTTPLQPTSPLLQPATSNVTAPGSILQTSHHSPTLSPLDAQSLETSLIWFASHAATLNVAQAIAQLDKFERILHAPGQTRPSFALIRPILAYTCGPDVDSALRRAGFIFLISCLEIPSDESSNLEQSLDNASIWHFIRLGTYHHLANDDWEQRLKALQLLTSGGDKVDGLFGLIPTLCAWQVEALEVMSPAGGSTMSSLPDAFGERIGPQRRVAEIQIFMLQICNKNVLTLTERDEECAIAAFLKALEVAIREPSFPEPGGRIGLSETNLASAPIQQSSSRASVTYIPPLQRSSSRHERNSSSQSLQLYKTHTATVSATGIPAAAPQTPWASQAAAFIRLFSVISTKGPPPSEYVHPAIQSMLFILGSTAAPLPTIGTTDGLVRRLDNSSTAIVDGDGSTTELERGSWQLISEFLSNGYSTTVAHEIRQHLVVVVKADGSLLHEMRKKSCGAARALRLALRQSSQHRLTLSSIEALEDPSAYATIGSSDPGMPRHAAGVGPSWVVTHARDIIHNAIAAWVAEVVDKPDTEAEAVVLEFIGIAKDIIAECVIVDRTVTDDEAHIVGNILCEAVQCLCIRHPIMKQQWRNKSCPVLVDAVSDFLFSVPLNMPLSPSPCSIALSVADHLTDSKRVALIDYIFSKILPFPSAPNWLPTIQEMFARLHGPEMPLPRRAIALHVRSVYDSVRDLANLRDPLVVCALESWEASLPNEENDDTVADILEILGDAIVAGAAEEQCRDCVPSFPLQNHNGLDHRIVDLLVRVAAGCECPEEASDYTTLHSTNSGDLSADLANTRIASLAATSSPRDPSLSPALAYSAGFTSAADDVSNGIDAANTQPYRFGYEPFLPHEKACKSMAAVLALILVFNRLAFSPPHSLDVDSPFKTARAPASSRCINVFENLLSLLGPTNTTTSLPVGEHRKAGHKQAACRGARLAILQWSVRLRADRDHRLYFKDDLTTDVDPFAQLLGRGTIENVSRSVDAHSPMEGESDARFGRKGRPSRRDHRTHSRPQTTSESRSESRHGPTPESRPPNEMLHQEQLWNLPDSLPFAIPSDARRPSEGMTTYSDQKEREKNSTNVGPDLWLSISTYVCTLTDLMEDDNDWEIFSYALCHLPLQLSNKHLFCGPRTRESICNMVYIMCNSILSDRLGSKTRIPSSLRNTDVWGLACQTLTIFVGYRDSFKLRERQLGETLVRTFCHGLNQHVSVAKPCLQALAICAYEFESATAKYLPQVLDHLVQVISKPGISRQVLELLAILGKMPTMHSNLRNSHFDMIFSTAGRYIQRHNRPVHMNISTAVGVKIESESFSLSQHVLVLAYYVVYVWYLGTERSERQRYIPTISRFLWIANTSQTGMDEMTEVCFDWLKRYTAGDVVSRPAQDAVLCKPNAGSRSWLLGNAVMTIEDLQARGWVGVTVRGASGVIHLTIRVDNTTAQRFEEIDPHTLLPRAAPVVNVDGVTSGNDAASPNPRDKLDPSFIPLHLSRYPGIGATQDTSPELLANDATLERAIRTLDITPVLELHKVGVMYVAPGQTMETEILSNSTGSPAYTSFLANLGHIVKLKDQRTIYPGGLDTVSNSDGEYAYIWWDEIAQIVFHAATMMPNLPHDPRRVSKKRHIGNDWVRIVWNDSGGNYRFDTLTTEFQLVNIVIEPHSAGITAAYSNSTHENEFFKLTLQRAEGVPEFGPLGEFKLLSLRNLPSYVRQISLFASLFAQVYDFTKRDTRHEEYVTNWRQRLKIIKSLRKVGDGDLPGDEGAVELD